MTKSTLVATSYLIASLVYAHPERCVLVSGFQHGRHWATERDRYLQLSDDHDVIALFAGQEPPAGSAVDHVGLRLRTGDPLAQEWFVLAVAWSSTWSIVITTARSPRVDARPPVHRQPTVRP